MEVADKNMFVDADGTFNSYRAYLTMINNYHTMPVVIAEYGVPSSRGRAQNDRNTGKPRAACPRLNRGSTGHLLSGYYGSRLRGIHSIYLAGRMV